MPNRYIDQSSNKAQKTFTRKAEPAPNVALGGHTAARSVPAKKKQPAYRAKLTAKEQEAKALLKAEFALVVEAAEKVLAGEVTDLFRQRNKDQIVLTLIINSKSRGGTK